MTAKKIIVIGAGMGGLAAAIDLARQGYHVDVVERAADVGGKMRHVPVGTSLIDGGPTVFTMKWVFDGLFEDAGLVLEDHLTLLPATILARHAWTQGGDLDLYADREESAEAIREFAGPKDAEGYLAFCKRSAAIYETLRGPFIASQRPNPIELVARVGFNRLGAMWQTAPHQTMWRALGAYFRDPRLKQLFGRYATYCGSSPFAAPATLMLVSHVEQEGVWRVKGGMAKVAAALKALAISQGVHFHFQADVERIETRNRHVSSIMLKNGVAMSADAIVFNGDISALGRGLLGPDVVPAAKPVALPQRSQSAITWCARATTSGLALAHHTVLFSKDYKAEFEDVFTSQRPPQTPTIYICAQDRDDACLPPDGPERLLILMNAPATGDWEEYGPDAQSMAQESAWAMMASCGLALSVDQAQITTPHGFNALFPASGGALYGRANHGPMASFQRPGARSGVKGLYLAGGSAHPGPGIPMAALSGRLAAARLHADLLNA
ncbi:1-hydroxycarotenoid 3,4-desaturase CrtD [Aquidulcibacter paucihalophilus]|uniref:1-hydroxycarotenoid 3,4-desaturase CrtD n=1 Tax=Aquidulcibacter paucihalophilus TaxID=1978549 RepID=UPI000A194383|nr:1-hydroxycarotenoid 3,4-desaturase CrtD [Aquidulcibacter paucihalophilus]